MPIFTLTHHRADGNRYIPGRGPLPEVRPLDIPLEGEPAWLLGAAYLDGTLWTAILEDGRVQAFFVENEQATALEPEPAVLPAGAPPILEVEGAQWRLLAAQANPLNHPILIPQLGLQAQVLPDGDLFINRSLAEGPNRLAVGALPDARILYDGRGRLLVLGGSSQAYGHAVLGDGSEATRFTLVDPLPSPPTTSHYNAPVGQVFEGLSAIWVDINGDGLREFVLTASDARQGAQIQLYSPEGDLIAASDPLGLGYRWRHQIAAAPFGPHGEFELASVRTPHLGGVVEFMRWQGERLEVVASLPGYTSHRIGSRNLDMAAAGDFDGDGRIELLLPLQDRTSLGAVRHTADGAQAAWQLSLEGRQTTNLAVARSPEGALSVGVGLEDGRLRLWLSR